ncbi:MAG: hypothetical protein KKH40_06715, partial [Nanoarchaeota archaeon]|nr:hypothetical protein [Nanoarchaeota archaeon]
MASEDNLKKAMFSYTENHNELEEENKLLKETVSQLRSEVERFRSPALLVAEVFEVINDTAIIQLS